MALGEMVIKRNGFKRNGHTPRQSDYAAFALGIN
jgi:hypothetical protein